MADTRTNSRSYAGNFSPSSPRTDCVCSNCVLSWRSLQTLILVALLGLGLWGEKGLWELDRVSACSFWRVFPHAALCCLQLPPRPLEGRGSLFPVTQWNWTPDVRSAIWASTRAQRHWYCRWIQLLVTSVRRWVAADFWNRMGCMRSSGSCVSILRRIPSTPSTRTRYVFYIPSERPK